MRTIYHITTRHEWEAARAGMLYQPESLSSDGFIYASYAEQLHDVADRRET